MRIRSTKYAEQRTSDWIARPPILYWTGCSRLHCLLLVGLASVLVLPSLQKWALQQQDDGLPPPATL